MRRLNSTLVLIAITFPVARSFIRAQEIPTTTSNWSSEEVERSVDGFDQPADFLKQLPSNCIWDGVVGADEKQTAEKIESRSGTLVLQSTGGRYQEPWTPLGPFLYKEVHGNFRATVQIVDYQDVSYNNAGIMARASDDVTAGKGEDWISIDYFPIYGGVYARMADNNRRSEPANNGQGRNADKYLQLERKGNLFFLRHSADGKQWSDLAAPFLRDDLAGVSLQVGLFQATYSGNSGFATFDNFVLEELPPSPIAQWVYPSDGEVGLPREFNLRWVPGFESIGGHVYLGTDRDAVAKATKNDLDIYQGCTASGPRFPLEQLEDGQQYFWRIDGFREQSKPSEVWSFSTFDRQLDDFEDYLHTNQLFDTWADPGKGLAMLYKSKQTRNQALLLRAYQTPIYSERSFANPQNWYDSAYNFRSLRIRLRSKEPSRLQSLAVVLKDADWGSNTAKVEYANLSEMPHDQWTTWNIELREFTSENPALRLSHIGAIGFELEGMGELLIDDLSIEYPSTNDPSLIQAQRFVQAVPFENVNVTGGIWRERMNVNRQVSLPHVWDRCEASRKANGDPSNRLDNFKKAAGMMAGPFTGTFFNDSDVYKIIEGTANSLRNHPDAELEAYTDRVIDSIAAAQWDDGYLFTFYSLPEKQPENRWSNVGSMHELYCAGHLIEAAIEYRNATGKDKLFKVAQRFADLICETFGAGKRETPPGHQEIELALIKLYEATENPRYLQTAKHFVDQRGKVGKGESRRRLYGTYSQDHIPFLEQEEGVGHSVRAGYLYCAATDLARKLKDDAYANALGRLWDNIVNKKIYLTGGIGQPGGPEGFAGNYQLGNNCYAETCSGIAFLMWNHRMHLMTGEAKYADMIERTLYNNMLSSLSREGNKHYYTNPLSTNGHQRWEWPDHDCACCPSNLVRIISSIGDYIYTTSDDVIRVNQYVDSSAKIRLGHVNAELTQRTAYPLNGRINLSLSPEIPVELELKLRIPSWARNQPMPSNLYRFDSEIEAPIQLSINGKAESVRQDKGYLTIRRIWKEGDTVELTLPMPVRRVVAHPRVTANKGRVAIQRGPIVYCAEQADNAVSPNQVAVLRSANFDVQAVDDQLGPHVLLEDSSSNLKLLPYFLHTNRTPGWMRVWLPLRQ